MYGAIWCRPIASQSKPTATLRHSSRWSINSDPRFSSHGRNQKFRLVERLAASDKFKRSWRLRRSSNLSTPANVASTARYRSCSSSRRDPARAAQAHTAEQILLNAGGKAKALVLPEAGIFGTATFSCREKQPTDRRPDHRLAQPERKVSFGTIDIIEAYVPCAEAFRARFGVAGALSCRRELVKSVRLGFTTPDRVIASWQPISGVGSRAASKRGSPVGRRVDRAWIE